MRRPTRRQLGYALLFSIPPGVGAMGFIATRIGTGLRLFAFGAVLTAVFFAVFLVAFTTGEADPDRDVPW